MWVIFKRSQKYRVDYIHVNKAGRLIKPVVVQSWHGLHRCRYPNQYNSIMKYDQSCTFPCWLRNSRDTLDRDMKIVPIKPPRANVTGKATIICRCFEQHKACALFSIERQGQRHNHKAYSTLPLHVFSSRFDCPFFSITKVWGFMRTRPIQMPPFPINGKLRAFCKILPVEN